MSEPAPLTADEFDALYHELKSATSWGLRTAEAA
jgi:hypothetical protein